MSEARATVHSLFQESKDDNQETTCNPEISGGAATITLLIIFFLPHRLLSLLIVRLYARTSHI